MASAFDPIGTFNDARNQAYGQVSQMRQDAARRRAGAALQSGDAQAAAGELYGAGDIEGGQSIISAQNQQQDRQLRMQQLQQQQAQQQAAQKADLMKRMAMALREMPVEQRAAAYQNQVGPALVQLGMKPEEVQAAAGHLDDASLDTFAGEMDKQYQVLSLGRGGLALFDKSKGANGVKVIREPDKTPAPQGYAWGDDGSLVAIPGGPADPRVIGSNATVRAAGTRKGAPPVGHGGGGGAAKPKPWERSY